MSTCQSNDLPICPWLGWLRVILFFLFVIAYSPCRAQSFPQKTSPPQRTQRRLDTKSLLKVEREVLPPRIVPGPRTHGDLENYYWSANPNLKTRLDRLLRKSPFDKGQRKKSSGSSVTLIAGTAGVGKSFLTRLIHAENTRPGAVLKIDLRELYMQWKRQRIVFDKPELVAEGVVLSRAMSLDSAHRRKLLETLNSQAADLVILDSLDEVHHDDYVELLDQVETYALRGKRKEVHVVVFGRHFAFRKYWRERRSQQSAAGAVELFLLKPPQFRTTGDLLVSSWNYHCWKSGLCWSPAGGEPTAMQLPVYEQWVNKSFSPDGAFRTVSCNQNQKSLADSHRMLLDWTQRHALIDSMLSNLAANGILRDIIRQHARSGQSYEERIVMKDFFDAWLRRNTQSSGRPSSAHADYFDLYLQLLEGIAVKYLNEGKLDKQGFFPVAKDDVVVVDYRGRKLSVAVANVLDRSGLEFVDPQVVRDTKYRFEPFWLHRFLVESSQNHGRTTGQTPRRSGQ